MAFPVSGAPSLSGTFIPQIWASKLLTKFYLNTVYNEICNTDYEGVIKGHGDEVKIRTRPDIVVSDYVKGAGLNYQNPTSPNVQLLIDQGHYFAFNLFDVDKHQSDINLMDEWGNDGAEQMKIKIDGNVLASIYSQASADNAGATAGKISGDIDLGTSTTPLALTKSNIVDAIVDFGTILDEQNRPEADRYIVLPAKACARIKTSELKDASLSGDGTSTLRNGKIGRIDRFNIYSSNNMNVTTGKYDVVFGHKSATTFAGQITDMESLKNPTDFGDLARSLFVYGFEVIDPDSLGHSVITVA
tara:strand:- start:169761 stop:170666 length:906 start_codon:yes stop_codon:yes gene_type:complete